MPPRILSFSGRKQSGKTLLANVCVRYGYQILSFADPIKNITSSVFGITRDQLERQKDEKFIKPCILTKEQLDIIKTTIGIPEKDFKNVFQHGIKSIREFLQILGTDILRKYNPDWHIQCLAKLSKKDKVCFADTRFPNELEFIKNSGGECWFITRSKGYTDISNHISEVSLDCSFFDNILVNTGDNKESFERAWINYMEKGVYPGPRFKACSRVSPLQPRITPMMMYVLGALSSGTCIIFDKGIHVRFKNVVAYEHFNGIFGDWDLPLVLEYLKGLHIIPGIDSSDIMPSEYQAFWRQGYKDQMNV